MIVINPTLNTDFAAYGEGKPDSQELSLRLAAAKTGPATLKNLSLSGQMMTLLLGDGQQKAFSNLAMDFVLFNGANLEAINLTGIQATGIVSFLGAKKGELTGNYGWPEIEAHKATSDGNFILDVDDLKAVLAREGEGALTEAQQIALYQDIDCTCKHLNNQQSGFMRESTGGWGSVATLKSALDVFPDKIKSCFIEPGENPCRGRVA